MFKLILSCIAVAVCMKSVNSLTPDQKAAVQAKLLTSGLHCIRDHPLNLDEITMLRDKKLPEGENAKCFTACLFKQIGIMDDMGKLNAANAVKSAEEVFKSSDKHLEKSKQIIQECISVNDAPTSDGAKGCDRAKLAFNCLNEGADKHGLHITF
ncbi:hypothetical protein ABMA28_003783 [Loxostege sticticalis]|uniref:Uncharacterized protein n=1 Tax=Loxostege sticticalis TaxID=481309 RepID=A0ABD0ST10_LOXSC